MPRYVVSVDIGGTFTDCVVVDGEGATTTAKARSTPADNFQSGFFESIEAAAAKRGLDAEDLLEDAVRVAHGSTVATNIMVEKGGADVALITTKGHEDTLDLTKGMGRIHGEPPENLLRIANARKPDPLVPESSIFGVTERIDSDGDVVVELDEAEVRDAIEAIREQGADAIAIALLWSFENDEHERRVAELIEESGFDGYVSRSSNVSSSLGEYERFTATAINSIVGPETAASLAEIESELRRRDCDAPFYLMHCNGGTNTVEESRSRPVMMIGSGPVGGLTASAQARENIGNENLIATDMGGTSFEVGLVVDGEPLVEDETVIDKYKYSIPKLDVTSIGAGGGSIASIDEVNGTLQVGPESAGADPGPVSYDPGGEAPTVTDADLLLRYIDPEATFGSPATGSFTLDTAAAEAAIGELGDQLGLSPLDTAKGIVEVAENKMANLIENEVLGRGFDPREFTLVSYGGAGPLHASGYAEQLGIDVYIPGTIAPLWSAYGISSSDVKHSIEENVKLYEPIDPEAVRSLFARLEQQGRAELADGGFDDSDIRFDRRLRMRLEGQVHTLSIPMPDDDIREAGDIDEAAIDRVVERFNRMYSERYGPATRLPEARVEVVGATCDALGTVDTYTRAAAAGDGGSPETTSREVYWDRGAEPVETTVYDGATLAHGWTVEGPTIVDLPDTSIVVQPGQQIRKNRYGDYEIEVESADTTEV